MRVLGPLERDLRRMEVVLFFSEAAQCFGDRLLPQGGVEIGGGEPGLALLIGARPDAVPLEGIGHQSGHATHSWDVEWTVASCRDAIAL